jgi:Family of unknown function (DUF5677)
MTASDPFPSNDDMRAATAELVAIVRSRLPMRYYGGESWWSMFLAAALTRMTDTVESLLALMPDDYNLDGRALLRSLYEQVVTFAWIGIDPDRRQFRWENAAQGQRLKLHNDAELFGETILTDEEIADIKKRLGIGDEESDGYGGVRKRKDPYPDRILPALTDRALEADRYWAERVPGLHSSDHLLGFRGLYLGVYRLGSESVHGSMAALEPYVTHEKRRHIVHAAPPGPRLTWALIGPLFGIALMIAAQQVNWIDEEMVRTLVDRATGPEQSAPPVGTLEADDGPLSGEKHGKKMMTPSVRPTIGGDRVSGAVFGLRPTAGARFRIASLRLSCALGARHAARWPLG